MVRTLRDQVGRLRLDEVRRLADAGGTKLSAYDGRRPDALLGDVPEAVSAMARELGIEITAWEIEVVAQPST